MAKAPRLGSRNKLRAKAGALAAVLGLLLQSFLVGIQAPGPADAAERSGRIALAASVLCHAAELGDPAPAGDFDRGAPAHPASACDLCCLLHPAPALRPASVAAPLPLRAAAASPWTTPDAVWPPALARGGSQPRAPPLIG